MSQRRVKRPSNAEIDYSEIEDSVNECVRYIVCREGSKIPIKRGEIIKHLSTVSETPANLMNAVIIEANKALKRVYGYKLVQVKAKSGIQYIVVLNEECQSLPSTVMDANERRLLVATLLHIFMSAAPVKEEEMYKFLTEAGLLEENDHASRKLLTTTFTRQMYLQYSKVGEGDLARYVFQWGERASEEVPKLFLLNKMAEAFEKPPDHWYEQYQEAIEETPQASTS